MKQLFTTFALITLGAVVSNLSLSAEPAATLPHSDDTFVVLGVGNNYDGQYKHLCHLGSVYIFISSASASGLTSLVDPKTGKPVLCSGYKEFIGKWLKESP